jgi:hypothetical protein
MYSKESLFTVVKKKKRREGELEREAGRKEERKEGRTRGRESWTERRKKEGGA